MNTDTAAHEVIAKTRRVVALQLGIGAVLAAGFFVNSGGLEALSAFAGGAISIISALLLAWGVIRAGKTAQTNQRRSMGMLYVGAVQRFLLVLALFALGLGVFGLKPLPMILGFGLTQLAYVFNVGRPRG